VTRDLLVELGGIEPPSVEWQLSALRPFPRLRLTVTALPGQLGPEPHRRVFPRGQRSFSPSAFFQAVTLRFCCRAAKSWPRAPLLVTVSLYGPRSGCESELAIGGSLVAPV
jgi:hypothetical protein